MVVVNHERPAQPPWDWGEETPMSVSAAFREVLGWSPSLPTTHRWVKDGVKVTSRRIDGSDEVRCVRLWTLKVGRRRMTVPSAVRRFLAESNPPSEATAGCSGERGDASMDERLRSLGLLSGAAAGPA
jgi:hypothetical protein